MLNSGDLINEQSMRPPTPHWRLALLISLIAHAGLVLIAQQQLTKQVLSPQARPPSMRVSVVRARPGTKVTTAAATLTTALTSPTTNNTALTTLPTPTAVPTPVNTVVRERPKPVPLTTAVEPTAEAAVPSSTPLVLNPAQLQQAIRQAQTSEQAAAPFGYTTDCPPRRLRLQQPDCPQPVEASQTGSETLENMRAALALQLQDQGFQARQRSTALLAQMDKLRSVMKTDSDAGRAASQQYYALEEEFFKLNPSADSPRSAPLSPTKSEAVRHDNPIILIGR
jgi:hypothetical protein